MSFGSGLAILGGTFDPVHYGHLRSAVEIREALGVDVVRLVPANIPPHRDALESTPRQRLEMLRLATDNVAGLGIDTREIERGGRSYAVDTLEAIRRELGKDAPLTMAVGVDAFRSLASWRDWRRLFEYGHIAVMSRPGHEMNGVAGELGEFIGSRLTDDASCLQSRPSGLVCHVAVTPMDISATRIRHIFASGGSPAYLLPDSVIDYIQRHGLYRASQASQQER